MVRNHGNETFTEYVIAADADYAYSVHAADIDGDSDIDVVSASREDNKIAWYENDGNENFTTHIISTGAVKAVWVLTRDLDDDGDMDVLSASALDGEINWYENLSIVSVQQTSNNIPTEFRLKQNYPNPFNPSTIIEFSIPEESYVELRIYDALGNEVAELVSEALPAGSFKTDFVGSNLASGFYVARLKTNNYSNSIKMNLIK